MVATEVPATAPDALLIASDELNSELPLPTVWLRTSV
jgi:hypothetical protein